MREKVILITGANGEIGHGLISKIGEEKRATIVALDLKPLDKCLLPYCDRFIQGDILDNMLLGRLMAEYEITTIFHLASIFAIIRLIIFSSTSDELAILVSLSGRSSTRIPFSSSTWYAQFLKVV